MAFVYSDLVKVEPEFVDIDAMGMMLGRACLAIECVEAGWIKPVVSRHKCTLYAVSDVRRAAARIKAGELPEDPRPKRPR